MANWFQKIFGNGSKLVKPAQPVRRKFSGLYDASLTTNARPFLGYWSIDSRYQVSNYDLMRLRSNSRKLFANLGEIRAPIVQRTEYAFGANGWRPNYTGADKDWGKLATNLLESDILPNIDVRGPMYSFGMGLALANIDMDRDGDVLVLFTEDEDGFPKVQYVPAHRIGQRTNDSVITEGEYKGCEMHHGVISFEGTPVAYQILGHTAEEDDVFSTDDAILIYKPEINGLPRGVPLASFALNSLEDMMVSKTYEQQALLLSSHIGLVETNPEGSSNDIEGAIQSANWEAQWGPEQTPQGPEPAHPLPAIQSQEIMGGIYKFLKSNTGSKLEAFKSERPSKEWTDFLDRLMREYCVGIPWPFELAWSPEKVGGASVRLVVGQAQRAVETRQRLFLPVAKRIIQYSVAKLIALGELSENDDWDNWSFTYPPEITVDAGRDERARSEAYKLGLLNLEEILREQGKTLEFHLQQRINEVVMRETMIRAAEKKCGFALDRNEIIAIFANPEPNEPGEVDPIANPEPSSPSGNGNGINGNHRDLAARYLR